MAPADRGQDLAGGIAPRSRVGGWSGWSRGSIGDSQTGPGPRQLNLIGIKSTPTVPVMRASLPSIRFGVLGIALLERACALHAGGRSWQTTIAPTTTCSNGVGNTGGLGLICEVTIVNTITAERRIHRRSRCTNVTAPPATRRRMHDARPAPDEPVTRVDAVQRLDQRRRRHPALQRQRHERLRRPRSRRAGRDGQPVRRSGGGNTSGLRSGPGHDNRARRSPSATARRTAARSSAAVQRDAGPSRRPAASRINQCNGSANGGGALVICSTSIVNRVVTGGGTSSGGSTPNAPDTSSVGSPWPNRATSARLQRDPRFDVRDFDAVAGSVEPTAEIDPSADPNRTTHSGGGRRCAPTEQPESLAPRRLSPVQEQASQGGGRRQRGAHAGSRLQARLASPQESGGALGATPDRAWRHPARNRAPIPGRTVVRSGICGFDGAWLPGNASRGCTHASLIRRQKRSTWQPPGDFLRPRCVSRLLCERGKLGSLLADGGSVIQRSLIRIKRRVVRSQARSRDT